MPHIVAPPARIVRVLERVRWNLDRLHQRLVPAQVAMIELSLGAWVSQAVQVAAELGIADALADGPLPLNELANRVGADPDALKRLMRALIGRGVFRQRRDGRYELTRTAATLRSDAPESVRGWARFIGSKQHREHWSLLSTAVRKGKAIVPDLRGKEFFEYLASEPEFAEVFNDAMTSLSDMVEPIALAAYDFSPFSTIADIGGGHGKLLAGILDANPTAEGVLFDLPGVVVGAPALLEKSGLANRVRIEGGSFFDSVPAGADAYILKQVIHDWPDEQAVAILRNVRAAAGSGATVLLLETVLPGHSREFSGNWSDLEMLLVGSSRERTAAEYAELLESAGWRLTRVVPTASPFSFVEAKPTDGA